MTLSKKVIADLMQDQGDTITISNCDVQWWSGSSDCGLFATAICSGCDPAASVLNKASMRQTYWNASKTWNPWAFSEKSEQGMCNIFCIWRLPDCGDTMMQCIASGTIQLCEDPVLNQCQDLITTCTPTTSHVYMWYTVYIYDHFLYHTSCKVTWPFTFAV